MVRSKFSTYVGVSLAISALVACGSASHPRTTSASAPVDGEPPLEGDTTRGMGIETAPDAVPGEPFILEATLHVRRLENGISVSRGEVRDGGTVMSGDRIQIFVRTTRDAHLYLAYCSQQAADPRYPGLMVFPPQGSIPVKANDVAIAPDRAAEIVLDNNLGPESLYLILSRIDLPVADPRVADAIAAARRGTATGDCGDPLHLADRGAPKVAKKVKKPNRAVAPVSGFNSSSGTGAAARPPSAALVVSTETGEPILDPTRGGEVVWMNGSFGGANPASPGLVVLRYGLQHIATPRP